ncbi:hypothetical protein KY306_00735 [Candidatus Woesearchaeota archaeon]|nr:hypothetical protein [Candidatus Woesearchaeota archaeon]
MTHEEGHPNAEPVSIIGQEAILYCPDCDYLFREELTDVIREEARSSEVNSFTPDEFCELIEKLSLGDPSNIYFFIPEKFRGKSVSLPRPSGYKGGPIKGDQFAKIPLEDRFEVILTVPNFAHFVGVRDHMQDQYSDKPVQIVEYYDSKKTYGSREEIFNQIFFDKFLEKLGLVFKKIGRIEVNTPRPEGW